MTVVFIPENCGIEIQSEKDYQLFLAIYNEMEKKEERAKILPFIEEWEKNRSI